MSQTLKAARGTRDLETELLDALQTKEIVVVSEALNGHSLVAVLRKKLAQ
jgi:hypothetical protein